MTDSPRNRRRTGSPSGSRPRVAGSRRRTTNQGTTNSENTADASGLQAEPTEVQSSNTDVAAETVSEAGGNEGEQARVADSAVSDAEAVADSAPAEAPEAATDRDSDTAADSERDDSTDSESDSDEAAESQAPSRSGLRRWLLPVMAACTVVFAVLAVWFQYEVHSLNNDGPAANQALADNAATSEVNGQVSDAVEKLFSYDFADTAKTEKAAKNLLIDGATEEYNQLFSTVKEQAPQQKLVVTTTVKSSGVTNLQDDRAEVLLFVDQKAVRTDNGNENVAPAQISVGAVKQGDQWKINKITQR